MAFPPCCIYGLVDPRTGKLRYIGKTTCGSERLRVHVYGARSGRERTHTSHWIRQLLASGLCPRAIVLQELPAEELCAAEVRWIAAARHEGLQLTNITAGGEGTHGLSPTAETRAKIGAALRGRKGPTPSDATRAKMSASHQGTTRSSETRARMGAAKRGVRRSEADKARMREGWAKRRAQQGGSDAACI
jgi:NUMOD3 motif